MLIHSSDIMVRRPPVLTIIVIEIEAANQVAVDPHILLLFDYWVVGENLDKGDIVGDGDEEDLSAYFTQIIATDSTEFKDCIYCCCSATSIPAFGCI